MEEVSRDLCIFHHNLTRWRKEYRKCEELVFPGHGKENLTPQEEKVRKLQKELNDVTTERDILKKPWPSSRKNRISLPFYPGTHCNFPCDEDVPSP